MYNLEKMCNLEKMYELRNIFNTTFLQSIFNWYRLHEYLWDWK